MSQAPHSVTTMADYVLDLLVERIVRGDIAPGAKLSEQGLANELKVSRAPLREAIRRLEGIHLVRHTPHAGVRVIELERGELSEIYQIREALEGMAARLSACNMDEGEINHLKNLLDLHEEQIEQSSGNDYFQKEGDFDFHYCIIRGSRNQRLTRLLTGDLYHPVRMYRYRSSTSESRPHQALAEHRGIVDAIESGDGELAEMLMQRHIRRARKYIDKHFPVPEETVNA